MAKTKLDSSTKWDIAFWLCDDHYDMVDYWYDDETVPDWGEGGRFVEIFDNILDKHFKGKWINFKKELMTLGYVF